MKVQQYCHYNVIVFLLFIQKVDKAIHWIFIHTVAMYRIVQ